MPVVERIMFVVAGIALLAGAFALFSYERTVAERARPATFDLASTSSTLVALPDAKHCVGVATSLLSPVPVERWREAHCHDRR